ncbi:MAG TPA: hypothetical protein IAB61_01740 [Candidatus Merdisoma merdipullorum]|nr:hypothetical protein [Candidatus Merdisoma merdipullorum]
MTERLSNKNPCSSCKVDRQIGNPNRWECECDGCNKPYDWKSECVKKLAEYETAEDEGRLVVLPCNPGITLYILRKKYTKCSKHNEEFDESSCCGCEDECDSRLFYYIVPCPDVTAEQILEFERLGALNKKIFFSKEEAEKALKEMEGKA